MLVLLQSVAAVRMWRSGLVNRFPIFTAWFATSAVLSLALLLVRQFDRQAYPVIYSVACLAAILLEAGCIVEAFFALCGKFRNFAWIGGTLLVILWLMASVSAAAVRLSWVPISWTKSWQMVMVGMRYADLAMVIVLAAAWLLLRIPGVPIAESANRVTGIIIGHALYGFATSTFTISRSGRPYFWMTVLPLLGGCATAACAAFLLKNAAGEYDLPPAPSREEVLRLDRDARLALYQFRQDAEDLDRLFRK